MLAALATLTDRVVVALIDRPVIPDPPDGCEYLAIDRAVYDIINAEIIDRHRCLKWRIVDDGAGSFVQVENLRPKIFYAICNSGDRAIVALDHAIPDFTRPGTETVEISQTDWLNMASGQMTHDAEELVPRWNCDVLGVVTPRSDVRPVLRVAAPGPHVAGAVTVNFALEDSAGVPMPVGGSRDILVRQADTERRVRITLVAGVLSVTPALTAGRYELVTSDSADFRLAGDTILDVAEGWT